MTYETLAPGCFGFPMTYAEHSPECSPCPYAMDCKSSAQQRLAEMRAKFGIETKAMTPAKPKRDPSGSSTLPKKVAEIVSRILAAGIRVQDALLRGENPFLSRPAFLRVACHLLIHIPDGFDRQTLRKAFEKKLNWTEGTASAHATQTFQVLKALGAAVEENGRLKVKVGQ